VIRNILVLISALAVPAASVLAGVTVDQKQAACQLQKSDGSDDMKVVKITFGKTAKGVAKLYIVDFFGKKVINAGAKITNSGKAAIHFHYSIAFFDKDGKLIGCASQGAFGDKGLAPGKETYLGSCMVFLPHSEMAKITSYKLTFYEADKPIGKE